MIVFRSVLNSYYMFFFLEMIMKSFSEEDEYFYIDSFFFGSFKFKVYGKKYFLYYSIYILYMLGEEMMIQLFKLNDELKVY